MRALFVFVLVHAVNAYQHEIMPAEPGNHMLGVSDTCTLFMTHNHTVVRFHDASLPDITWPRTATVKAVNKLCDRVLFGYPALNTVVIWNTRVNVEWTVTPPVDVDVHRFGWSLDIQGHTWVVGAPGRPNDYTGNTATLGYAFVYEDQALHSCRSLFDTYCYTTGTDCQPGFQAMKDANNLTDAQVPAFQQQCADGTGPQPIPQYDGYTLVPEQIPYFAYQQFGYAVVLTGPLHQTGSALFVSAPGDTNRFMEDNAGANYGRVYMWDSYLYNDLTWWKPSVRAPLLPPTLESPTYRAFGRSMAAARALLAVGSYPLYDEPDEPFVLLYECLPERDTDSNCVAIPERGVSVNDLSTALRQNILGYMTTAMFSYTDGKTLLTYIPADIEGDGLPDFQNAFIGDPLGVTGSNVLIPDWRHNKVYRYGNDARLRETHPYLSAVGFSSDSQHWVHENLDLTVTHQWNCPLGHTGPRSVCTPCSTSYYSDDGWLEQCDPCPVNFTTNVTGQSECIRWYPPEPSVLKWEDALFIMGAIMGSCLVCFGLFAPCGHSRRTQRF